MLRSSSWGSVAQPPGIGGLIWSSPRLSWWTKSHMCSLQNTSPPFTCHLVWQRRRCGCSQFKDLDMEEQFCLSWWANITMRLLIREGEAAGSAKRPRREAGSEGEREGYEKATVQALNMQERAPPKGCGWPPEGGRGREADPPRPPCSFQRPNRPCERFRASELCNCKRIDFCGFQPLNLQPFVTVSIGN